MQRDRYLARRHAVSIEEVAFGPCTMRLLRPEELADAQIGYGGGGGGDNWAASWLVIATEDWLGDPIFTDLAQDDLPVFTAPHGVGVWVPVQIAGSFEGFVTGLKAIASVSKGRENPVALEANPLADAERDKLLALVREANPTSVDDDGFWEAWLGIYR